MILTKTICTLGPISNNEAGVRTLSKGGMNIARMNFSHGSHETHSVVVENIKKVNKEDGNHVGLLLDTKGAEIRTGDRPEPLVVAEGDLVTFSHKLTTDENPIITVNYPEFSKDAKDARFILIDSGELIFDVVSIDNDRVVGKSTGNASIGSRRHINLPGSDVTLPSLAEKDWLDIELACKLKLDYIALSFIRNAKEVEEVRAFTTKHGHPEIQLISKIENGVGVDNIDEIIEASDGIMIARGDLGAEIPLETLPFVQDDIVDRCRTAGKPVIMATQMLESMIKNPMPTRAEVTDVAHAVHVGVDSTMLSGETAAGKFPFASLKMMKTIIAETENYVDHDEACYCDVSDENGVAAAAVSMADGMDAAAIVVYTKTGATARAISKLRPGVPVFLATDNDDILRRHQLYYALMPLHMPKAGADAIEIVKEKKYVEAGDKVVVVKSTDGVCNVFAVTI